MAKAGEAAKARSERKANIKQKRKFSNKNSIGKTRRNVGSEARYVTRTGAVKKLQVRLPSPGGRHTCRLLIELARCQLMPSFNGPWRR